MHTICVENPKEGHHFIRETAQHYYLYICSYLWAVPHALHQMSRVQVKQNVSVSVHWSCFKRPKSGTRHRQPLDKAHYYYYCVLGFFSSLATFYICVCTLVLDSADSLLRGHVTVLTGWLNAFYMRAPLFIIIFGAHPIDAQSDLDLGNFVAMLTLKNLCCYPLAVVLQEPVRGPSVTMMCGWYWCYAWSWGTWFLSSGIHMNARVFILVFFRFYLKCCLITNCYGRKC